MDTLRIGFIGLGGICRQRHVPGLKRIEGVSLAVVANRSEESSKKAAEEFGIPEICADWREIVARKDIDAVFIGTWPYMHKEMSLAALAAGKHVFCQARMAMNLAEALAMQAAARESGLVAMLCPVPFGLRIDRTIARILREGTLGAVRYVAVRSAQGLWRDPAAPLNWRKDIGLSGLNVQTLGMYAEVVHRWFGPTHSLSAETFVYTPERRDASGVLTPVRVPDQVMVNATMAGGVAVQYVVTGMAGCPCETMDIWGEKGALHYDVSADVLYSVGEKGEKTPVLIPAEEAYDVAQWRVEEDFINAIRRGSEYHPDFNDGVAYMRFVQAVHDSMEAGRRIILANGEES